MARLKEMSTRYQGQDLIDQQEKFVTDLAKSIKVDPKVLAQLLGPKIKE